jgi:spermidine synthase
MDAWYTFFRKNDERISYRIGNKLLSATTKFQTVEVFETVTFGRALFLDGSLQSTSVDEFTYHEAIAQPAMCLIDPPRRVFIAGGGEGAVLREVLKHPSVEEVWMVDIDAELVAITRTHLPEWHRNAFDDPRVSIFHQDARTCLANAEALFDVVIVDVTAPKAGSQSVLLYTREFYKLVRAHLSPVGVLTTQAQSTNVNNLDFFSTIYRTMSDVFEYVYPYSAHLAADGDAWGYVLAGACELKPLHRDIDTILSERGIHDLRLYDSESHRHMFSLPKYVRQSLHSSRTQASTDAAPFSYPALAEDLI